MGSLADRAAALAAGLVYRALRDRSSARVGASSRRRRRCAPWRAQPECLEHHGYADEQLQAERPSSAQARNRAPHSPRRRNTNSAASVSVTARRQRAQPVLT